MKPEHLFQFVHMPSYYFHHPGQIRFSLCNHIPEAPRITQGKKKKDSEAGRLANRFEI